MDFRRSHYLAGFADGEGCFMVVERTNKKSFEIRFKISQRIDSGFILEQLQKEFGGYLSKDKSKDGKYPRALRWRISSRQDVLSLISYFDHHPPIVKYTEYKVWREAAIVYYRHSVGHEQGRGSTNPNWLVDVMRGYSREVSRLKLYDGDLQ